MLFLTLFSVPLSVGTQHTIKNCCSASPVEEEKNLLNIFVILACSSWWVRSTFLTLCPQTLSSAVDNSRDINYFKELLRKVLGFKPLVAGWEAPTLYLWYAAPPPFFALFLSSIQILNDHVLNGYFCKPVKCHEVLGKVANTYLSKPNPWREIGVLGKGCIFLVTKLLKNWGAALHRCSIHASHPSALDSILSASKTFLKNSWKFVLCAISPQ